MKQLLEWWLGTWRDFHWVWSGNLLVLMGCWRWWDWCCYPGGQRSQLSRFPKPCQLNAPRPCELLGPQGHEPEGDGAEFTAQLDEFVAEEAYFAISTGLATSLKNSAEDKALGNWRFWHHFRTWSKTKRQCSVRRRISRGGLEKVQQNTSSLRVHPLPHNESLSLSGDYLN